MTTDPDGPSRRSLALRIPEPIRPVVRRIWRFLNRRPADVWDLTGGTVAAGLFLGMKYGDVSIGSVLAAKLLGTYERELHGWLGEILETPYARIHVVGCAEGYYAVGLARSLPNAEILAYDLDPRVPAALASLAARNGVANWIGFHGAFNPATLSAVTASPELIGCDIEGAEVSLLDPDATPALAGCDVLVEVHDGQTGAIEGIIVGRFAHTHRIRRTCTQRRTVDDLPPRLRPRLTSSRAEQLMDEGRKHGLSWLWMQSIGSDAAYYSEQRRLDINVPTH